MIGLVLAAGAGRRLRPDTDEIPKTLLPVRGEETILDIALGNLAAVGLTDVAIVVGYAAEAIRRRQTELERTHRVNLELIENDRALVWNNAYSLWLARRHFTNGALVVNGDTVHPLSVEKTLLENRGAAMLLAIDTCKRLADEEMKVRFRADGQLVAIHKSLNPATADGEYIGACIIEPGAAEELADALQETWRKDPQLYYEDGIAEFAARGGVVRGVSIGEVAWVEVDNHEDLALARRIACQY